jgi:hypothetical protein
MPNYLSPGVYVEEVDGGARPIEGVGTAVAAFIGTAPKGPVNEPVLVTNWSQYTQIFGEFMEGSYLDDAVYGYFLNGGGAAYIVRVGGDGAAKKAAGALPAPKDAEKDPKVGPLEIEAVAGGADGNDITVEVSDPTDKDEKGENFKLVVKVGGKVEEEYDNLNADTAVRTVNAKSKLIKLASPTGAKAIAPTKGSVKLAGGGVSEPARLAPDDYIGSSADRTGFGGLEAVDEITMLACPDLMAAYQNGLIDLEGVQAVQLAMIAHCESMGDRLAILDPPPGLNAQQIKEWRVDKAGYDSKYAVLYWPWVKVFDPGSGENIFVPPSGHMAGIWGRNDDTRGVHKAPANEVVRGAIDLELRITKTEHDLLNPEGINVIRAFPGRGIRVWGARTLSSDPAWRYVNVRRLFNYLEESILGGTQWTVFEPNDHALWAKIRRAISAFLVMEWRKGALFGLTPGEAFYVKCDGENNPAESIDAGMVVCEIGVAPVKPAEFVVFKLSQFSGGASSVAE